jgi:putative ABC transport system ATP-binding protein
MGRVIETRGITKTYHMGDVVVRALQGVDLTVDDGDFLAVMGASGSGKSTLMNVLGCLDKPTSGEYRLGGIDVASLSSDQYAEVRNQRIGFVFQGFNLLARTSALDNVELPLMYDRSGRVEDPRASAVEALERVGLGDRLDHDPNELSGGEQQRVAIARALVNRPSIILADEPTGNLDSHTSLDVMALFQELNGQGITVLIVTHEHDLARYTKRTVTMRDGVIVEDHINGDLRDARRDHAEFEGDAPGASAGTCGDGDDRKRDGGGQ